MNYSSLGYTVSY